MIKIALHTVHKGKHPPGLSPEAKNAWFRWYNGGFSNRSISVEELGLMIAQGYGYTTQHRHYRKAANFIRGQHIGLDFDELPVHTALQDLIDQSPFIEEHASLLHTTASHTPEEPRARVIFILDRPISNAEKYTELAQALLWRFDQADPTCKDACRLFFGAEDCELLVRDNVLTLEAAAEALIFPFCEHKEQQRREAEARASEQVVLASDEVPAWMLEEKAEMLLARVRTAPEGEKYYTLRDISRTFGGYVAGGYYSELDVRSKLQAAIETRRSTVKSMRHAYATIDEGLAYGRREPLEFELPSEEPEGELAARPDSQVRELETLIRELPAGDPAWPFLVEEYGRLAEEHGAPA